MGRGVHHLAIKCRDLAAAEELWVATLGLDVMRRHTDERGVRAVWLALGPGSFLALERADDAGPARADGAPGWHCVALSIAALDRERWRARLAERGYAVSHETVYTLYVRDADGTVIALSHYPHVAGETTEGAERKSTPPPGDPDAIAGPDVATDRKPSGVTSRLAALVTLS